MAGLTATSWSDVGQLYALLPFLIIMMIMSTLMKTVSKVTEPEFIKEVKPLIGEAVTAKRLLR